MIRTLLAWLYRALGRAGAVALPELRLPEWRKRQLLQPTSRMLVPSWFASKVMREDNLAQREIPIQKRIGTARRNAVALGFRKYHRLSAIAPKLAA